MSQEISGVSDALPLGNDTEFEETSHRKGHRIPGGSSTVSTIQPYVDHRMMPQLNLKGGGIPFVSNKSKKSFGVTMLLLLCLGLLGVHDFYAGNTGKCLIKLFLCVVTAGIIPLLWGLFDFFTLCNGTYQDGNGKYI